MGAAFLDDCLYWRAVWLPKTGASEARAVGRCSHSRCSHNPDRLTQQTHHRLPHPSILDRRVVCLGCGSPCPGARWTGRAGTPYSPSSILCSARPKSCTALSGGESDSRRARTPHRFPPLSLRLAIAAQSVPNHTTAALRSRSPHTACPNKSLRPPLLRSPPCDAMVPAWPTPTPRLHDPRQVCHSVLARGTR